MYEKCPNGCDNFVLFSCELDSEHNAVIYQCSSCDWEKIEHNPFYSSAWVVSINQTIATIDIFQSLLTDNDTIDFLRPKLKGRSFLGKYDNSWEFTVGNDEYLKGWIDTSNQTFLRQMTILAATYIELILKDFFDSFFTTKPFELLKLLAENDSAQKRILGAVSIQKILDNTARDAMAEHAFNTMQNEDMWGIIRKLAKRTPIKSDWKLLFNELHSLITQRNSIVHNTLPDDSDKNQADIQKIYNYFDLLIKFLIVLEQIAQKNNIPYWKDLEYSDSSPVT